VSVEFVHDPCVATAPEAAPLDTAPDVATGAPDVSPDGAAPDALAPDSAGTPLDSTAAPLDTTGVPLLGSGAGSYGAPPHPSHHSTVHAIANKASIQRIAFM
jgi:hypothetical protein